MTFVQVVGILKDLTSTACLVRWLGCGCEERGGLINDLGLTVTRLRIPRLRIPRRGRGVNLLISRRLLNHNDGLWLGRRSGSIIIKTIN